MSEYVRGNTDARRIAQDILGKRQVDVPNVMNEGRLVHLPKGTLSRLLVCPLNLLMALVTGVESPASSSSYSSPP